MIEEGIDPRSILLFTFTRKGANEIKERIASYIGEKSNGITIGTYHSFCLKLLKSYYKLIGWEKNFTIFDDSDQKTLLRKICPKDYDFQVVGAEISKFKDNMISPRVAMDNADSKYKKDMASAYNNYQLSLKSQNAFDFDDIIYFAVRLFENFPEVTEKINERYKFIIFDEGQDSSPRDLKLIEFLGGKNFNVCAILDDDQSIYSFRGSNIKAIFEFIKAHSMKEFVLGQNYRSTKTIVDASRSVIKKNDVLFKKKIFSENESGEKIYISSASNQDFEASQVVVQIKKALREGMKPSDIAILYRMNFLSRKIEDTLLKNSIPYQVMSGISFYGRKEIKDLICYLRFIYNDADKIAFERIFNMPKRGLGKTAFEKVLDFKNTSSEIVSLTSACKNAKFSGTQQIAVDNFVAVIELCREMISTNTPAEILKEVINQINYFDYLRKENPEDADERIGNVNELIGIAQEYNSLAEFIDNMTVSEEDADLNSKSKTEKVSLMTMHGSKGLEFPFVIIIGASEGIVPSSRSVMEGNLQEERRLFYVAMTRAKKKLFVTYPKMTFNRGVPVFMRPSRFLSEIGKEFIAQV